MVSTTYQTRNDVFDKAITNLQILGFSGQLKVDWIIISQQKINMLYLLLLRLKPDDTPIVIVGCIIPDSVSTLIFIIIKHFIGDPSIWKDRLVELLLNLKCKTLSDLI